MAKKDVKQVADQLVLEKADLRNVLFLPNSLDTRHFFKINNHGHFL